MSTQIHHTFATLFQFDSVYSKLPEQAYFTKPFSHILLQKWAD